MNDRPISKSKDKDLRGLEAALHRARLRARSLARATDTRLVFSRNGVIEHIVPEEPQVAEHQGGYGPRE